MGKRVGPCGQWPRPDDSCACALRCFDNALRGLIQYAVIISLETNANLVFSHRLSGSCQFPLLFTNCPHPNPSPVNGRGTFRLGFLSPLSLAGEGSGVRASLLDNQRPNMSHVGL